MSATNVRTVQPVDVRWDWSSYMDGTHPSDQIQAADDELMVLLDLIHRKSMLLRNEVDDSAKVRHSAFQDSKVT